MKQPFPFHPFEDSLTGQILGEYFQREGKLDELNLVFQNFKKNEVDFYFTTRVEKQNILNILPDKIRKKHSEKAFDEIFEMLYSLLNSDSSVKME